MVKYVLVAGSDAEARTRVLSPQSSYRYAFGYLFEVLKRAGRLGGLKTHPDQPDSEVTVESIIEARVVYGSPQTVAEKLIAFRQDVGPFGTVLLTGVDWAGPNEAWERESTAPPFHTRALACSSLVLWVGVMFWGSMLPFIGNAF